MLSVPVIEIVPLMAVADAGPANERAIPVAKTQRPSPRNLMAAPRFQAQIIERPETATVGSKVPLKLISRSIVIFWMRALCTEPWQPFW
jgi:hypothetical protein